MADFQLHEQVRMVTFAGDTTGQWRVFIDPDSGREVDRHPVLCCAARNCAVGLGRHPLGRGRPDRYPGITPRGN